MAHAMRVKQWSAAVSGAVVLILACSAQTGAAGPRGDRFDRDPRGHGRGGDRGVVVEGQVKLGAPVYGGTGCPGGSAGVAVSPDGSAVSVLFDRFSVANRAGVLRSQCSLRIPAELPAGTRLSVVQVDYRGFASLSKDAQLTLRTTQQFAHKHGRDKFSGDFDRLKGETTGEFRFTQTLARKWDSECGGSVEIAMDVELMLARVAPGQGHGPGPGGPRGDGRGEGWGRRPGVPGGTIEGDAQAAIDTLDLAGGAPVTYRIELRRCQN